MGRFGTLFTLCMATASILADVRLPPHITKEAASHMFYRSDATVVLECEGEGTPAPEYEWKRNGELLNLDNTMIRSQDFGTLTIHPASSLHEGYYQCLVSNDFGTALSVVTHLQRAFLARSRGDDVSPYEGVVGGPMTVTCTTAASVPPPTYSWVLVASTTSDDSQNVLPSQRVNTDANGNLYFANLLPSDSRDGKLYKCNAFNNILDTAMGGSYSTLTVKEDASVGDSAPTLLYSTLSPHKALVGHETRLKCFFAGSGTPELLWEKDGNPLPLGNPAKRMFDTELWFEAASFQDAGVYTCKGKNSLGYSEAEVTLNVESIPEFIPDAMPSNKNASEGTSVTFECRTDAKPPAQAQWLINGEPLDHAAPGPRKTVSADGLSFTIEDLCRDCPFGLTDLMVVQCNASNENGYAFSSGYLNVLVATKIEVSPRDAALSIEDGDTVAKFHCEATSDISTPVKIIWRKDDEPLYIDHDPRLNLMATGSLVVNLTGLSREEATEDYEGVYTCLATNGYLPMAEASAHLTLDGGVTAAPLVAASANIWWIFLIAALVLLLIIIFLCCCICHQRNKGESYPVDEKERLTGNDPEKEIADAGFHDYQRPEDEIPVQGSRMSLGHGGSPDDFDDEAWMDEYDDFSAGRFNEDGSFIGEYTDTDKQRRRASQLIQERNGIVN